MIRDVYVDLYFLINLSMNLLCLMITASLLHRPARRWRAILAAGLGALYAVLSLLYGLGGFIGFFTDVSLGILMCSVTFLEKRTSPMRLFKYAAVHLLTSMLLGGIMTALYTLLNQLHLPLEMFRGDAPSVWSFAILSALAAIFTARGGRFLGRSAKTRCVTVNATLFGRKITLRALVDTGNLLRDPVSGKSVIVADRQKLLDALPRDAAAALASTDPAAWLSKASIAQRVRILPMHTANGESLLPALLPDALTLTEGKQTIPSNHLIAPAILATHADGYDAVIGAE